MNKLQRVGIVFVVALLCVALCVMMNGIMKELSGHEFPNAHKAPPSGSIHDTIRHQ